MSGEKVTSTVGTRAWRKVAMVCAMAMTASASLAFVAVPAHADPVTVTRGELTLTQTSSPDVVPLGGAKVTYTLTVRNDSTGNAYRIANVTGTACSDFRLVTGAESVAPQGTSIYQCSSYALLDTANEITLSATPSAVLSPGGGASTAPKAYYCSTDTPLIAFGHQGGTSLVTPTGQGYANLGAPSALQYDGLAYRVADGFAYAVTNSGALVRVSIGGAVANLGSLKGLAPGDASGITGGTIVDTTYYIVAGKGSGAVYVVDIDTRTATPLDTQSMPVSDLAFAQGSLWGMGDPTASATLTLYRLPLDSMRLRAYRLPNTLPFTAGDVADTYGAMWTSGAGNLVMTSQRGSLYEMKLKDSDAGLSVAIVGTQRVTPALGLGGTLCPASPNAPKPTEAPTRAPDPKPTDAPTATASATAAPSSAAPSTSAPATKEPITAPATKTAVPSAPATPSETRSPDVPAKASPSAAPSASASATTSPSATQSTTPTASASASTSIEHGREQRTAPAVGLVMNVQREHGPAVKAGDSVVWSFDVTNLGSDLMSKIMIESPQLQAAGSAVACEHDLLAPGVTVTCTSQPYPISATDVLMGSVTANAVASGVVGGQRYRSAPDSAVAPVGDYAAPGVATGATQADKTSTPDPAKASPLGGAGGGAAGGIPEPSGYTQAPEVSPVKAGSTAATAGASPVANTGGTPAWLLVAGFGSLIVGLLVVVPVRRLLTQRSTPARRG